MEAIPPRVSRLGVVARFKPVHLGHLSMLEAVLSRTEHLSVGLGSSNRHDLRNPWSCAESEQMLRRALGDRSDAIRFVPIPDLGDGPRWRELLSSSLGPLDLFVTANEYVRDLMQKHYPVVHPLSLIPADRRVRVDGTQVRRAMARGEDWRALVPAAVAEYLEGEGLVERFRREFGLETLALEATSGRPSESLGPAGESH